MDFLIFECISAKNVPCSNSPRIVSCLEFYTKITRMHSSRMRTARSSGRPGGGGVSTRHPPGSRPPPRSRHPPVNRITDACKNITVPQTSFAGGNNYKKKSFKPVWFLHLMWQITSAILLNSVIFLLQHLVNNIFRGISMKWTFLLTCIVPITLFHLQVFFTISYLQ